MKGLESMICLECPGTVDETTVSQGRCAVANLSNIDVRGWCGADMPHRLAFATLATTRR